MNIKPMLVRLEGAMARNDLIEEMVLIPEPASAASRWAKSTPSINLIVGYNASPKSQIALDLTMWIAHLTRLATQKSITVQAVYVVDERQCTQCSDVFESAGISSFLIPSLPSEFPIKSASRNSATSVLSQPKVKKHYSQKKTFRQSDWFEQADCILRQARCLAEEWGVPFTAHLRFGNVAEQLRAVVESEAATLLFLGCNSVTHPIVQKLDSSFPCSVLGIPTKLSLDEGFNFQS